MLINTWSRNLIQIMKTIEILHFCKTNLRRIHSPNSYYQLIDMKTIRILLAEMWSFDQIYHHSNNLVNGI